MPTADRKVIRTMDEQLIKAINDMAEGKEEGFNAVYSATYNYVYFRARQHTKNDADAQDLTQIVYVEAYKSIKNLQNAESLFWWLEKICLNQGMKLLRKNKDILASDDEDGRSVFDMLESNDISSMPELSTEQKETSKIIQSFIEELPELQRVAVVAYYFDGLSVGEIAQMQDCSEGTVKSRLNYARKFLKDKVEGTEKRDGIRLHVFALPTIWYAIKLMSERTILSDQAANDVYAKSCAGLGLIPGAVAIGGAGAGVCASLVSSGMVQAGITGITGAGTAAVTGMAAMEGAKIATGSSSTASAAAVGGESATGAATGAGTASATGAATGAGTASAAGTATGATAGTTAATAASTGLGIKALIIATVALAGVGIGTGATYVATHQDDSEDAVIEESDAAEDNSIVVADAEDSDDASSESSEEIDEDAIEILTDVTVTGEVFLCQDVEEYMEKYEEYREQYDSVGYYMYGIRFDEPLKIIDDGVVKEIDEAAFSCMNGYMESFVGQTITAEGFFAHHVSEKVYDDLYREDLGGYTYFPSGEFEFTIRDYEDISEVDGTNLQEANADFTLSEEAKIQIANAIGFYSYYGLPDDGRYVYDARYYMIHMLCNSLDVDAVLPWETDGKLTASQIEDFWKAFGITLPYDYSFNDNGVTPNSDYDDQHFTGDVELITFGYESLDIKYNGDGTFTLNGKFKWAADGDDYYEIVPFTATAIRGGSPDVFDGLIIRDFTSDYDSAEYLEIARQETVFDYALMAQKASTLMKTKQAEGVVDKYDPRYFVYDITGDGIPELFVQEGTCEADYVINIYGWYGTEWLWSGTFGGGHLATMWGKNSHDGVYLSVEQMGYQMVSEYDQATGTQTFIYEGEIEYYYDDNDNFIGDNGYVPADVTQLNDYRDLSTDAVQRALETGK